MTKEKNSIGLLAKTAISVLTGVVIGGFLFVFNYEFGNFISRFINGWEALAAIVLPVFPFALVISAAFVAHKKGQKELAKALVLGMVLTVGSLVFGGLILRRGG